MAKLIDFSHDDTPAYRELMQRAFRRPPIEPIDFEAPCPPASNPVFRDGDAALISPDEIANPVLDLTSSTTNPVLDLTSSTTNPVLDPTSSTEPSPFDMPLVDQENGRNQPFSFVEKPVDIEDHAVLDIVTRNNNSASGYTISSTGGARVPCNRFRLGQGGCTPVSDPVSEPVDLETETTCEPSGDPVDLETETTCEPAALETEQNAMGPRDLPKGICAPPSRTNLLYARIDIFHNIESGQTRQAEWVCKFRMIPRDAEHLEHTYYAGFQAAVKYARRFAKRIVEERKMTNQSCEEFYAICATLPPGSRIGFMSAEVYHGKKAKNADNSKASTNERWPFAGYYAVIDIENDAPVKLTLYCGDNQPIDVGRIRPVAERHNPRSATHFAYYDPDNIHTSKREVERIARDHRSDAKSVACSPVTAIGIAFAEMAWELDVAKNELNMAQQRIAELERELANSRKRVA